ncbi:MAG: hypothetical protein CMO66_07885 [Verrucomicrobiales bacterium]|nr:hypothetical protein [Verrucomicrobiales bacterium]
MDRTETTFFYERLRAVSSGVIETAVTTFLLLIAVKVFPFGATAKALIAAAGALGFLAGPLVVSRVAELGWTTSKAASRLTFAAMGCYLVLAAVDNQWVFMTGVIISTTLATAAIPLVTQIYQENYPTKKRGRLFSRAAMIRIVSAGIFGLLAGWILTDGQSDETMSYPRWLLLVFACAFAMGAFCYSRLPSKPLKGAKGTHPFRSLRFVKEDKLFRHILICWMLFGIGNLMLFPLRVEYLANSEAYDDYKLAFEPTPARIALILVFIPNVAKLICSPFWGRLFDKMNFFVLRVVLNFFFATSLLLFFHSESMLGLCLAAALFGIGNSGGEVAWSLWVTKFAPAKHVADYMSVHVFFNGIRIFLSPFLGFWLMGYVSAASLSLFSAGLIIASSLALLSDYPSGEKARRGAALTEEVTD